MVTCGWGTFDANAAIAGVASGLINLSIGMNNVAGLVDIARTFFFKGYNNEKVLFPKVCYARNATPGSRSPNWQISGQYSVE